jgi:copper chaperone CopZ
MIKTREVQNMHCSSCAEGIESLLRSQEGIKTAKVDYETGKLRIEHTEEAELDEIWKMIEEMGYEVERDD